MEQQMAINKVDMSGRLYNAMAKFCGNPGPNPALDNMFFHNGRMYATDSYAALRWTPCNWMVAEDGVDFCNNGEVVNDFYFIPLKKFPASQQITVSMYDFEIDAESKIPKNIDALFERNDKNSNVPILGINPKYLANIAALGKAVKSDKCGDGTVAIDWVGGVLHCHINGFQDGVFDIVVMPIVDMKR